MARELACCILAATLAMSLMAMSLVCAEKDCSDDVAELLIYCKKCVLIPGPKIPPSKKCCDIVHRINMPCVCQYHTNETEKVMSMEKVVFVAESCKRPLPHGSKCGSYTVPLTRA